MVCEFIYYLVCEMLCFCERDSGIGKYDFCNFAAGAAHVFLVKKSVYRVFSYDKSFWWFVGKGFSLPEAGFLEGLWLGWFCFDRGVKFAWWGAWDLFLGLMGDLGLAGHTENCFRSII
jgi:hypothetical protein